MTLNRSNCDTFDDQHHYNINGVILCLPKSTSIDVIKNFRHLIKMYSFVAARCGKCIPDSITNDVYVLWYHDIEQMYYLTKNGYNEIVSSNFEDVIRVSDEQFVFVRFTRHEIYDNVIIIGNATPDIIDRYEYMIELGFVLSSNLISLKYPGKSYYFKYNAMYQVYLLNGETSDGDFTISSSNFEDIDKQLHILNIL